MTSIRPPLLLLDVDGVLNAMRWELPPGWEQGVFNGYVLSWDPTITARLRDLHESGRVEIQWLTTRPRTRTGYWPGRWDCRAG